ncbi:NADP-dependent oxidoreductase [Kribbella sp. NPDC049227]|uniref:NADP-dependent oxidoreductase n=1 Tax=Kribbella sp. NPDC049227 TaxID=3364113 RepID=UPI00371ABCC5
MHAVQINRFGGPEVLEVQEVDPPVVRDGEVLVRTVATSINPIDRKLRIKDRELGFPLTLGWDLAGVVVESSAVEFGPGDRVIGMSNVLNTRNGTWADLVAMPAADLAPAPESASLIEAATLPLAGLTALQTWRSLEPRDGHPAKVLVIGAAGAIGAILVQLAVHAGVVVDGVVSRPEHLDPVTDLGAVTVTMESAKLPAGSYAAIIDTVGLPQSGVDASKLLTASGRYVAVPSVAELPTDADARKLLVERDPAGLKELSQMVDEDIVRLRVAGAYPLRDIRTAHTRFESGGLLGKIVVVF